MKLFLLVLTGFAFLGAHAQQEGNPLPPKANLEAYRSVKGYFDADQIEDLLVIYADTVESETGSFYDTCIARKAVIYTGKAGGGYALFHETETIFPCPQFNGRSDNDFDTLLLERGTIHWRTCVAPRFSSQYSVQTYTFTFAPHIAAFTLTDYRQRLFASANDDLSIEIYLKEEMLADAGKRAFEMDRWESGMVFSAAHVRVRSIDLEYWKKLTDQLEQSKLYREAIAVQEMILHYFPQDHETANRLGELNRKYK